MDWIANFALIEVFPIWQTGISLGWILVCFAVMCLIAIAFIGKFLQETKNHSVEQVAAIFEREAPQRPRRLGVADLRRRHRLTRFP